MSLFTLEHVKLILIILRVVCSKKVQLEQYLHLYQKMDSASGHHWCMGYFSGLSDSDMSKNGQHFWPSLVYGFFSGLSDSDILFYVNEQIRVANEVLLVINEHRMYFNSLCLFQIFTLGLMKLILEKLIVACTREMKLEQYIHWHKKWAEPPATISVWAFFWAFFWAF